MGRQLLVLIRPFVSLTQAIRVLWEKVTSTEKNVSLILDCTHVCGTFSWLMIGVTGPRTPWAVLPLGEGSCSVRRQAKKASRSQLLPGWWGTSYYATVRTFFHKVLLVMAFCDSDRNQTNTKIWLIEKQSSTATPGDSSVDSYRIACALTV